MGEAELQRMVREFYRYFGNLLWEILFWRNPGPQRLQNWVRFDNPEVLDSLAVEGKGVKRRSLYGKILSVGIRSI